MRVGIQFCQIGNDRDATAFFEYLDDELRGGHKLGRDVSNAQIDKTLLLIYSR